MIQGHVKLLHDGNTHWSLSFCSNGRGQTCNSVNSVVTETSKKSMQALHKSVSRDNANVVVTFFPLQKQQDDHNCVFFFVVAFSAKVFDGKSPIEAVFHFSFILFIA